MSLQVAKGPKLSQESSPSSCPVFIWRPLHTLETENVESNTLKWLEIDNT
jgi:hypothetical protein